MSKYMTTPAKRCRHRDVRQQYVWDCAGEQNVVIHRCGSCDAWLPLGPSADDDPRVKTEIVAARVAADLSVSFGALCAFLAIPGAVMTNPIGQLARVIIEHEQDGGKGEA